MNSRWVAQVPMNNCGHCGAPVRRGIPPGEDRPRYLCDNCHTIHYENPKVVVGCMAEWEEKTGTIGPPKGYKPHPSQKPPS